MLVRMYVWDGTYYQTGVLDTSAPAGKQCLNPDPQSFTSIQQMIDYAAAKNESIQQVTIDQVNALCSGQTSYGTMQSGAQCCLCQGGGSRNFVPGTGNTAQPPTVIPSNDPIVSIQSLQNTVAGRVIAAARRKPLNTIVY